MNRTILKITLGTAAVTCAWCLAYAIGCSENKSDREPINNDCANLTNPACSQVYYWNASATFDATCVTNSDKTSRCHKTGPDITYYKKEVQGICQGNTCTVNVPTGTDSSWEERTDKQTFTGTCASPGT